jgi:hypothetical protein
MREQFDDERTESRASPRLGPYATILAWRACLMASLAAAIFALFKLSPIPLHKIGWPFLASPKYTSQITWACPSRVFAHFLQPKTETNLLVTFHWEESRALTPMDYGHRSVELASESRANLAVSNSQTLTTSYEKYKVLPFPTQPLIQ